MNTAVATKGRGKGRASRGRGKASERARGASGRGGHKRAGKGRPSKSPIGEILQQPDQISQQNTPLRTSSYDPQHPNLRQSTRGGREQPGQNPLEQQSMPQADSPKPHQQPGAPQSALSTSHQHSGIPQPVLNNSLAQNPPTRLRTRPIVRRRHRPQPYINSVEQQARRSLQDFRPIFSSPLSYFSLPDAPEIPSYQYQGWQREHDDRDEGSVGAVSGSGYTAQSTEEEMTGGF